MNVYVGNAIEEIRADDKNIEFSDELLDFLYKVSEKSSVDMSQLCKIDPYADVVISKSDLPQIIEVCSCIIKESQLEDYEEAEDGREMLLNLIEIAQRALKEDAGLVSIGD